jgi:hypothetical protein
MVITDIEQVSYGTVNGQPIYSEQATLIWKCSMEPVSWRPGFAPPATPLTRRLLVYFRSGAYSSTRQERRLRGRHWRVSVSRG